MDKNISTNDVEIIKRGAIKRFCQRSDEQMEALLPYAEVKFVDKGDTILAQGQIARYIYIVCDGLLRQHVTLGKKDRTQKFYVDHDVIIAADSLYSEEPSTKNISAITDCVCVAIDYKKIFELSQTSLDAAMCVQLLLKESVLVEQSKSDDRLYSSAKDRYVHFCKMYPVVSLSVNVSYIASYLNMAPETLSRLRSTTLIDYASTKNKLK